MGRTATFRQGRGSALCQRRKIDGIVVRDIVIAEAVERDQDDVVFSLLFGVFGGLFAGIVGAVALCARDPNHSAACDK